MQNTERLIHYETPVISAENTLSYENDFDKASI